MKKVLILVSIIIMSACGALSARDYKSLKLLVVTDKFPWSSRPFINNQIAGLIDRGHQVYIYATTPECDACLPQCLEGYRLSDRIYYKNLPKHAHTFDAILVQFPQSRGAQPLYDKHKSGELKGKLILFFRGEDLSAMIKKNTHRYDKLFAQADLCLPVCEYFKERLMSLGCPERKIHVIHSAIDCDKFPFKERFINNENTISLVSACRLVPKKGIKFALLAAIRLHQKYPNLNYTIIGSGPEREMLLSIVELMGAKEYVYLVGQLAHDEVEKRLNNADIFILPSVTALHGDQEGIPNALMEAMAVGLPVVSSYHAGIPELVHDGQTGFLAAERDVETLVKSIAYIIEHPHEMTEMARRAREYVEQAHNTDIENDRLEQLLLGLFK